MNKAQIIELLATENLAPQKSKGQNFLVDENIARSIVDLLHPHYDSVLEIGPGLGALTVFLSIKAKNLTVVELDRGYASILRKTYPTIKVEELDFLKYSVPRETTSIISNIPYYITTKIIEKVLLETDNLQVFVFMVQKDVENRLFAKPNNKEYGPLAILLSLLGTLNKTSTVTADKFYPLPYVDSAVFKFVRKPTHFNIPSFYRFVKNCFLHRRKILFSSLVTMFEKDKVSFAYEKLDIKKEIRSEALNPEQILALFHELTN